MTKIIVLIDLPHPTPSRLLHPHINHRPFFLYYIEHQGIFALRSSLSYSPNTFIAYS